MYDINCVTARHIEAFTGVPSELAEKITLYRKKRKRIRHIDELWRIRGMKRRYFDRLNAVFYVPGQVVPRIGDKLPYANTISTVTVPSKHQKQTDRSIKKRRKKRKRKDFERKDLSKGMRKRSNGKYVNQKTCIATTKPQRMREYRKIAKAMGKHAKIKNIERSSNGSLATTSTASSQSCGLVEAEDKQCGGNASKISRWLSNLPNYNRVGQGVSRSPSIKSGWYSYYYKKYEKESSGQSKKKKSKVVFEERAPETNSINLFNTCTIL